MKQIRDRVGIVSLSSEEYFAALQGVFSLGVVGASFYDALIARCAIKAEAETILTWNVKHFVRFGPEVAQRIATPADLEGR